MKEGVPSIVIGIRYIHDHVGTARLDDYQNAVELILNLIKKIDANVVAELEDNL
ncbi:MAG: hypothetical protein H0Z35_06955 [Thermoanaerobacteraceae bacterium]|nr:hypothetical protein [Thermoanaerobacteraceae bacterium]